MAKGTDEALAIFVSKVKSKAEKSYLVETIATCKEEPYFEVTTSF
jgi:hypothetical protein